MKCELIARRRAGILGEQGLFPVDEVQAETMQRLGLDKDVLIHARQPRNPKFHRLAFALFQITVANTEVFQNIDALLRWLKIKLGHVETIIGEDGKVYYELKSIAFASMSEPEFRSFFDGAMDLIVQKFGFDRPTLLNEIEGLTGLRWSTGENDAIPRSAGLHPPTPDTSSGAADVEPVESPLDQGTSTWPKE